MKGEFAVSLRDEYEKRVLQERSSEDIKRARQAYYGPLKEEFVLRPLFQTVKDHPHICPDGPEKCSERLRAVFKEAASLVRPDLWYTAPLEFDPAALSAVPEKEPNRVHLVYSIRNKYVQVRRHDGGPGMFDAGIYFTGQPYKVSLFGSEMPRRQVEKIRSQADGYYNAIMKLRSGPQRYFPFLVDSNGDSYGHRLILFEDGNPYQPWGDIPGYFAKALYSDTENFVADLLAKVNRKK